MKKQEQIRRTESASGFHYINLFQACPRKWYLRYLKGFRNKFTAKPLIQGSAFHEGTAAYYQGKSEKKCIKIALEIVEAAKEEMLESDYEDVLFRIPHFIHYWVEQFGRRDLAEFDILAVEEELRVPLLDTGYEMTIRPDAIVRAKDNHDLVYIMEKKTSGFSHRVTSEAVYYGDQATAYTWGVRKVMGIPVYAVQPDIAYWNKSTRDLSNMKFIRGDLVFRDEYQTDCFEKSMAQLFTEVNQKAEAYRQGYDPWLLFPRNSHYCLSFSTPCDFAEICMKDWEAKRVKTPHGFIKTRTIKRLGGPVADPIFPE